LLTANDIEVLDVLVERVAKVFAIKIRLCVAFETVQKHIPSIG